MILPFGSVATIAQVKQHFLFFFLLIFFTISSIPLPPLKNLADFIPGLPLKADTSIPESSANATTLSLLESAFAFLCAFSRKLFPFSITSNPFGEALTVIFFSGHILLISFSLSLFEDAK